MATFFVYSGATGLNNGTSWTDAYTAFGSAVTAAVTSGDIIKVHKTHTEELAVTTTYTFLASVNTICVDKDAGDALAVMGTAAWIGHSTLSRTINISSQTLHKIFMYGITFRTSATSTGSKLNLGTVTKTHFEYEKCYFWLGSTKGLIDISISNSTDDLIFFKFKNCTFRFGNVTQSIKVSENIIFEGGSISSLGVAPTNFLDFFGNRPAGGYVTFEGFDFSHLGGNNIVGNSTNLGGTVKIINCKMGVGFVLLANQTAGNRASSTVYLYDSSSGDTHMNFAYADAFGTIIMDSGIFFTSGVATVSWKIVTTANCTFFTPFVTPWLDKYNDVLTAQSPYLEILKNSAVAYQDDEVWGEFSYKGTSGFTTSTMVSDRMTILGTPADQTTGAGVASWTGDGAGAVSQKVESGSITPLEIGHIRGRIIVGQPSSTVYVDPQIRV